MSPAQFVAEVWAALGGSPEFVERFGIVGDGELPSAYRVTDLAVASIGAAGLAAVELVETVGTDAGAQVTVDRAVASAWFGSALEPVGWEIPDPWDPLSRSYPTADGWIRLHTNAPHHRRAALAVLEVAASGVSGAVERWDAVALQEAIVAVGGCAAALMTTEQWRRHPQGAAVAAEPLIAWSTGEPGDVEPTWAPSSDRPLAGLRVLDLTRVISGPVATRFLAGLGADVLRIDPPGWREDSLVPDMTLGKRAARLDATTPSGLDVLRSRLVEADVLVHGYRDGALDALGLDNRHRRRPGLVEVSLDAYGYSGPWSGRRGFDSLVQMSSGIAAGGAEWAGTDQPTPLPVQALDHSAGYLLAAAALRGLVVRSRTGRGVAARTSLARVAALLVSGGRSDGPAPVTVVSRDIPIDTPWGPARLLPPPATIGATTFGFERGPAPLGSDPAAWPRS